MACATLALLLLPRSSSASQYDRLIERSANTFMPSVDWRLWKAQVKAESAFNPLAKSSVGAMGLSQIMPATFAEIAKKSGITGSPFDPEINLMAGAFYMARMRNIFKAPRPDSERHKLAMASYNAGAGNIIRAQKLTGNSVEWQPVADKLYLVTGRHSKETVNYVSTIQKYYRYYLLSGD